jgi:acid phosphatase family membrane protein YuiD
MIEQAIISIILACCIAQTTKLLVNYQEHKIWDFSQYLRNGGMPSSHTAVTIALTASLAIDTGLSYLTLVAAVFTAVVINDAMKVREETGEEAEILNGMMDKMHIVHRRLSERVGHKPIEVFVGAVVGVIAAMIGFMI